MTLEIVIRNGSGEGCPVQKQGGDSGVGRGGVSSVCDFRLKDLTFFLDFTELASTSCPPASSPTPTEITLCPRSSFSLSPTWAVSFLKPRTVLLICSRALSPCLEKDSGLIKLGNSQLRDDRGQLWAKPTNWKRFQPHLQVSWEKGRVSLMGRFHPNHLYQIYSETGF